MGMFEQILGGPQGDRFQKQQADFSRPDTDDFNKWTELVGSAPPDKVEEAYTHAARQVPNDEYRDHVTPGVRNTNPLGELGGGMLGTLAGRLLGGLGGGVTSGSIPGMRTTKPEQMSEHDVAVLADYMRRNHPEQFGKVAADVGRENPGMLQKLMGNKMLLLAAAGLAGKLLTDPRR
ncbi:MAG: hypothetical protein ACR2IE_00065 [Candidatus Sumerlaeaceae bacterium]